MCDLIEAAFLSHGPLPLCASEKSRLFTVTPLEQPVMLVPTIVPSIDNSRCCPVHKRQFSVEAAATLALQ